MKRILVAVDTTNSAPLVVAQAVELARAVNAKVRLFHAVPMPAQVPPPGIFVAPSALHVQELVDSADAVLHGLAKAIPEELRDGICSEIGNAPERVCEMSRKYDPDIVVIGAHEYGLVARALGTTAARIVNRIDRPVFVVRPLPPTHVVSAGPASARV